MATAQVKLCVIGRGAGSLLSRQAKGVVPSTFEGQRFLSAHPEYKRPYPYKEKKFGHFQSLMDYTTSRFNENTRIIAIEGLPCVGKSEFAANVSNHFKLLNLPAIGEKDLYEVNGYDIRQLNDLYQVDKLKITDLADLYSQPDPSKLRAGGVAMAQDRWFTARYFQYIQALRHLLSTGQGVVLENSVYGDVCYANALRKLGYYPRGAYRHYEFIRKNTLLGLWKPHLIIYLDAPSDLIIELMKKKNPELKDSPVLNTKYIDAVKQGYEQNYLPSMRPYCEVLTYDVTTMDDFDLLSMDFEALDLMDAPFGNKDRFGDWRREKEEEFSVFRLKICNDDCVRHAINWRPAWEVPEIYHDGADSDEFERVWQSVPELRLERVNQFGQSSHSPLDMAKGGHLDQRVQ